MTKEHNTSTAKHAAGKKKRAAAPALAFDLPFRSTHDRPKKRAKAHAATRAAVPLPYRSQVAPGASENSLDCGPACVRMALDFLNLAPEVSIDEMSNRFDIHDNGTTAADLVSIAQAYGADAITHSLPPGQLPPAPAILLIRYNFFPLESVQDQRYWHASAANPGIRHWAWWLGNTTRDNQEVSVWNDPLYRGEAGKNVIHSVEALRLAFEPYDGMGVAVTFPRIAESQPPDTGQITVEAFDAGGINLRSAPNVADATTIIALMPHGTRFEVLEPAQNARLKLGGSSASNQWLRVRTKVNGIDREGFVAGWLVREVNAPPPPVVNVAPYTWQHVINATVVAATQAGQSWTEWLDRAGFWRTFVDGLRGQPYTGPAIEAWPVTSEQRASLADLLKLGTDELIALVIQEQQQPPVTPPSGPVPQARTGSIIGIHGPPGVGAPPRGRWEHWLGVLKDMGVAWYKQCDDGDPNQREILEWAKLLKRNGIEPIIRYYAHRQFPAPLPNHYFDKMRLYADAGIQWAEIGNEPNLPYEWQEGWEARGVEFGKPEVIRALGDAWVGDAQRAIAAGVKPALYAFGPTEWNFGSHPQLSSVMFSSRLALYLADQRRAETISIFKSGGWFAVHSATYEKPIDFNPFLPNGGFWDMTLRGYEIIRKCFVDTFGQDLDVQGIPIMSTEGGVFTPESDSMTNHDRLRTDEEHAQRVVDMFSWLSAHSPLQAMCPWCLTAQGMGGPFDPRYTADGWFKDVGGSLQARPVVERLKQLRASQPAPRAVARGKGSRAGQSRPSDLADRLREIGIFELPTPKRKKTKSPPRSSKPRKR